MRRVHTETRISWRVPDVREIPVEPRRPERLYVDAVARRQHGARERDDSMPPSQSLSPRLHFLRPYGSRLRRSLSPWPHSVRPRDSRPRVPSAAPEPEPYTPSQSRRRQPARLQSAKAASHHCPQEVRRPRCRQRIHVSLGREPVRDHQIRLRNRRLRQRARSLGREQDARVGRTSARIQQHPQSI